MFSDQTLDLMSAQVELAIRVGWLAEQHMQARQIGTFRQLLVAPDSWRKRVARLREPDDIASLPFIANTALRDPTHWRFSRNELDRRRVAVQSSISIDTTLAVREAVLQGAGCRSCRTTSTKPTWRRELFRKGQRPQGAAKRMSSSLPSNPAFAALQPVVEKAHCARQD